ncbi:hypothetical protein TK90_2781 (plasmid) [Thioalkalivibrio sp. K90mix]|nr:hypothetical protein TK90_2781 [Thioalkalivibrio sp. K90mix]
MNRDSYLMNNDSYLVNANSYLMNGKSPQGAPQQSVRDLLTGFNGL